MKPGIICSNSGIPGGDAKTQDNPGKPGILGWYDSGIVVHKHLPVVPVAILLLKKDLMSATLFLFIKKAMELKLQLPLPLL